MFYLIKIFICLTLSLNSFGNDNTPFPENIKKICFQYSQTKDILYGSSDYICVEGDSYKAYSPVLSEIQISFEVKPINQPPKILATLLLYKKAKGKTYIKYPEQDEFERIYGITLPINSEMNHLPFNFTRVAFNGKEIYEENGKDEDDKYWNIYHEEGTFTIEKTTFYYKGPRYKIVDPR